MEFNTPILAYQGRKGEWDGSIPSVGVGDGSAIAGEYNEALSATFTQADRAQFVGTSAYNHVADGFHAGVSVYIFTRTSKDNPALSDRCPPKQP